MSGDLAPDWILKAALATQDTAHKSFVRMKPELRTQDEGLTMTVLGCGTMGTALLKGLLTSLETKPQTSDDGPHQIPTKFNACVRSSTGAKRVHAALEKFDANVQVFEDDNVTAVKEADMVLLACKSRVSKEILSEESMREALEGKLLISIVAGIPRKQLLNVLSNHDEKRRNNFIVVRAAPNLAVAVGESMTAIARPGSELDEEKRELVDWIFKRVGKTVYLVEDQMPNVTALCSSGPAICALIAESLAAGAIRSGVHREEAHAMVTQVLRGTVSLLENGEHPAALKERASASVRTAAGIDVLEESALRATISKALSHAAPSTASERW
ncbi:unnamed protein product [Cercospora beticola]|nr:unnamed protein product [Cercospora beticola]